jgi:hypothetical protein
MFSIRFPARKALRHRTVHAHTQHALEEFAHFARPTEATRERAKAPSTESAVFNCAATVASQSQRHRLEVQGSKTKVWLTDHNIGRAPPCRLRPICLDNAAK